MPPIETHAPGSFCWVELATTDQNSAKKFYTGLFGWDIAEFPISENELYTMFQIGGRDAGAAYTMNKELRDQHVPPHWMLYIATASADDTAAKAAGAGGKTVAGPFDVMTFGRMAVLQDPAGATFSVWEAKTHKGIRITGEPGTLCWADLSVADPSSATGFYKSVFGWDISPGQDNSGYLHIKNGDQFIGGVPPAGHRNPNAPPHWLLYFLVQDCDASTNKARELGATVYMPPTSMEGVGRWSVVADPQGAVFALFQSAH